MREEFCIAAFRSRQQVLRFEDVLRREGVNVRIVTTPRTVAMGCGLSVRFALEDAERVRAALRRANPGNLSGVYRVEQTGGRTNVAPL